MTEKEYKLLRELDGFLNELRILFYSKYYKEKIDNISKKTSQSEVENQISSILKKPFFEIDISKEHKSFRKEYRLRKNSSNRLSINLEQYEEQLIKLLAMLNDYERNTQCDTKTTNGKYFGYLANGLSNEVK